MGLRRRKAKAGLESDFLISGDEAMEETFSAGAPPPATPSDLLLYDGSAGAFQVPCSLNGLAAAASGGALGWVFGFGSQMIKHSGPGRLRAGVGAGWTSASSFASFGGVYAAAACVAGRLRDREDAINAGLAGCATGLAMGWSGGPLAAAQSCAGLGAFSWFLDRFQAGGGGAARAAAWSGGEAPRAARPPRVRRGVCGPAGCPPTPPLAAALAALPPGVAAFLVKAPPPPRHGAQWA